MKIILYQIFILSILMVTFGKFTIEFSLAIYVIFFIILANIFIFFYKYSKSNEIFIKNIQYLLIIFLLILITLVCCLFYYASKTDATLIFNNTDFIKISRIWSTSDLRTYMISLTLEHSFKLSNLEIESLISKYRTKEELLEKFLLLKENYEKSNENIKDSFYSYCSSLYNSFMGMGVIKQVVFISVPLVTISCCYCYGSTMLEMTFSLISSFFRDETGELAAAAAIIPKKVQTDLNLELLTNARLMEFRMRNISAVVDKQMSLLVHIGCMFSDILHPEATSLLNDMNKLNDLNQGETAKKIINLKPFSHIAAIAFKKFNND